MIDKVLGAGASFDYLSPLVAILGDLAHGGGYTFLIAASDMTPREIEAMLRARGITTWGAMIVSGTLMISVRKQDAQRAYTILQAAGVPVENPPKMAKSAPKRKRPERAGSPFKVFEIFDR